MRPKAAHAREPKGISLRPCAFAFCCSASAKQLRIFYYRYLAIYDKATIHPGNQKQLPCTFPDRD
jgi:hypothetical protein